MKSDLSISAEGMYERGRYYLYSLIAMDELGVLTQEEFEKVVNDIKEQWAKILKFERKLL